MASPHASLDEKRQEQGEVAPAAPVAPQDAEAEEGAPAAQAREGASDEAADEEFVTEELDREGGSAPGPFGVGHAMTRAPRLQPSLRVAAPETSGDAGEGPAQAPSGRARVVALVRKAWRVFLQLSLIVCICLAGERIADVLPIDVPSNICSMIVLLVFLVSGVLKMDSISEGADFLLDHMSIFFIPAAVAIMGSFDLIAGNVIKLVLICLITTVLVFFVTSFTVSTVMNLMVRRDERAAQAAGTTSTMVADMHAGVQRLAKNGKTDGKDAR